MPRKGISIHPAQATRARLTLIGRALAALVSIDLRALAVFRIGVGLFVLIDLAVRMSDLTFFYSDDGVLPRSDLISRSSPWTLSLFTLSGAPAFEALLFALAAVSALALLIGYRTRTATALTWFLLLSLQNRNPFVNQNGDLLLHLILFWSIWLPLGARLSLDAARHRVTHGGRRTVCSPASVALLAQPVIMYVFAAQLKTGVDWRNGTAVYYALQYRLLATSRAGLLLPHTDLLSAVSHSVMLVERFAPLLLFVPVVGAPIRAVGAIGIMFFHLGMSTFLDLGPFMWVPELALIPFLPPWFWDHVEAALGRSDLMRAVRLQAAALPRGLAMLLVGTLVAGPSTSGAGLGVNQPKFPIPEFAGDSSNRDAGDGAAPSQSDTAGNRPVHRQVGRALLHGIVPALLLLYALLLNLRTVTGNNYLVLPGLQWLGDSLGLNQRWSMFAPNPPHTSGWFVVPGTLRNGRTFDFWRGPRRLSWREPASILDLYPSERWRKYAESVAWISENDVEYARYLCRSWNTVHTGSQALVHFTMYFMALDSPPPSHPLVQPRPRRVELVNWYCFRKPA